MTRLWIYRMRANGNSNEAGGGQQRLVLVRMLRVGRIREEDDVPRLGLGHT